jgi:hypothetical protein
MQMSIEDWRGQRRHPSPRTSKLCHARQLLSSELPFQRNASQPSPLACLCQAEPTDIGPHLCRGSHHCRHPYCEPIKAACDAFCSLSLTAQRKSLLQRLASMLAGLWIYSATELDPVSVS